jgi:hypothetical protein
MTNPHNVTGTGQDLAQVMPAAKATKVVIKEIGRGIGQ